MVIESCEVGLVKPNPSIYKLAQTQAGLETEQLLFVDDHVPNIETAIDMGWNGYVFDTTDPERSVRELERLIYE